MATMMPVKRTRWMLLREPSRICAPEISVEAAIVPATVTRAADNAAGQRLRDVYVDRTLWQPTATDWGINRGLRMISVARFERMDIDLPATLMGRRSSARMEELLRDWVPDEMPPDWGPG